MKIRGLSGAFGEVTPTDLLASTDGHVPAERIPLMMDCCHVAGLVGERRAAKDHRDLLRRYHGTGYATLGAAGSEEHSIDSQEVQRSVFTHHLVEGLSGKADADENGVVVLSELAAYVGRRVGAAARKRRGLARPRPASRHAS